MRCNLKKNIANYVFVSLAFFAFVEVSWGTEYAENSSQLFSTPKKSRKRKVDSHELKREDAGAVWVQEFGITPKDMAELQILNASFWAEVPDRENINPQQITPTKTQKYYAHGGTSREIESSIQHLKKLFPNRVQNKDFVRSDLIISSPAAREILSRENVKKARKLDLVSPLPPIAFVEQVEPETKEQRRVRKERQKAEFEAAEAQQGNFPQQLSEELADALEPWKPYFAYIQMKKTKYLEGHGNKLRWPDLVGAFLKYVAPYMTCVEIDGYEVYFSLKTLKFKRNGQRNLLNHESMAQGLCPIGADGQTMNYHHVTKLDRHVHQVQIDEDTKKAQEGPYKIVLIPGTIHTEFSGLLHCEDGTYILPHNEINRSLFGNSRQEFNKTLAAQFFKG